MCVGLPKTAELCFWLELLVLLVQAKRTKKENDFSIGEIFAFEIIPINFKKKTDQYPPLAGVG
jgi:hypothetical protein